MRGIPITLLYELRRLNENLESINKSIWAVNGALNGLCNIIQQNTEKGGMKDDTNNQMVAKDEGRATNN